MAQQKTMTTCPECGAKVSKDRLKGHIDRVHKKTKEGREERSLVTKRAARLGKKPKSRVSPWPAIALATLMAISSLGAYVILTQPPTNPGNNPPAQKLPVAVISVSHASYTGTFRIELRTDVAPTTANNFIGLADRGFYNGLNFHRIASNPSVIQGGAGGSVPKIPFENTGLKNVKYSVAMARSNSPDSATSQFYINTADNLFLDSGQYPYVVFGMVTQGQDVIDYLKSVHVDGETPNPPVVMTSVTIET